MLVLVRVVFARDVVVVVFVVVVFVAVVFVPLAVFFAVAVAVSISVELALRKSCCNDNTVAAEHVDVERSVCLTDSTLVRASDGNDVTAITGYIIPLWYELRCIVY